MAEEVPQQERRVDESWVHADLRSLFGLDVDDLRSYSPDGPFCIYIRAMIGLKGSQGEESFDFHVCSPEWLALELERHEVMSAPKILFMADFNYRALENYVRKRLSYATGQSWDDVARKLSEWSYWEFEDYAEYEAPN